MQEAYKRLENGTKDTSGLVNYNFIRLEYNKRDFEKPPEIKNFSDALKCYYGIVTGKSFE